jgi:hypothetical protein
VNYGQKSFMTFPPGCHFRASRRYLKRRRREDEATAFWHFGIWHFDN